MTTGKVRGAVGQSRREPRAGPEESSDSNSTGSTSDPAYEGIGVAVCTERKSSTGAWQFTLQVRTGLGIDTGWREPRFCSIFSGSGNRDERNPLTFNKVNINVQTRQEKSPVRPKDQATGEAITGGVDGLYVGNDSKVAGWMRDVRVGGRQSADVMGSVGLVGEGGSDGGEATAGTVRALLDPSTKSIILTVELR